MNDIIYDEFFFEYIDNSDQVLITPCQNCSISREVMSQEFINSGARLFDEGYIFHNHEYAYNTIQQLYPMLQRK